MTNKNLHKANKIVAKATTAFSDTIVQVEKANDLLAVGIEKDSEKIYEKRSEISKLNQEIEELEAEKAIKNETIESNTVLIHQLYNFVPTS